MLCELYIHNSIFILLKPCILQKMKNVIGMKIIHG
ncbi:hypothetical protein CLOBY_38690 [Clostridium saccharobutylicum]|nr:hypothetical protein CLOSC_39350 [Clostridium saccharobutylicum]OAV39349.1 hypothetical protein M945_3198 [Clostridium saccharobutylicum DSM 13864]AQS02107.1 hypothetical protein CSACC_39400 [Clostridium saccharobutylicum]AQS11711.1 hypothetical protein CLOBY_38690 [Clostridium saccharobutylicum]AQS16090.1 hypothetical protein CLOSACC_39400 [Clostridium saccharobutylicum]